MKALVLTRCENISTEDRALIHQSNLFKICVNYAPYSSDIRLFHDDQHWKYYSNNFKEPLATHSNALNRYDRKQIIETNKFVLFYINAIKPATPNKQELFYHINSVIPAIDYCIKQNYQDILIVGDNTVYSKEFQEEYNKATNILKNYCNLYQFSNGNFDLATKSIEEFHE